MRYLVVLFILASGLFVLLNCNSSQKKGIEKQSEGATIYQQYCIGCHGPNLQQVEVADFKDKSVDTIASIIMNGRLEQGMPAFQQALSPDQIISVASYMKNHEFDSTDIPVKSTSQSMEVVVGGLEIPWGMEFLPNGEMLIAERKGKLSRWNGASLVEITGLPEIRVKGQGGLMDLKLHPDYEKNGWIYISYSYVDQVDIKAGGTAIIRAQIENDRLINIEEIYKGFPATRSNAHFGSRMVFDREGYLYFTNGDRRNREVFPQSLENTNGKVHRLNDDGTVPPDNPFVNDEKAVNSIYSYGHRNPQGIAMHPETGRIWESEHGPKGGDEINLIEKGKNYGWPVISYGINYDGTTFTDLTAKQGMEQPVHYYVPSIAPCGMAFVSSDLYGDWKNSILLGSLSFRYLERIKFDDLGRVIEREKLLEELNSRVRDVREGPDGYIYVALEQPGRIIKLLPEK